MQPTRSLFYKGWLIRDGNMRLVEVSKFLGMETSLIEKLRDGGNLLISQAMMATMTITMMTTTKIAFFHSRHLSLPFERFERMRNLEI